MVSSSSISTILAAIPGDIAVLVFPRTRRPALGPPRFPPEGLLNQLAEHNGLKNAVFMPVGYGLQNRVVGGGPPFFQNVNPVPRMFAFSSFNSLKTNCILTLSREFLHRKRRDLFWRFGRAETSSTTMVPGCWRPSQSRETRCANGPPMSCIDSTSPRREVFWRRPSTCRDSSVIILPVALMRAVSSPRTTTVAPRRDKGLGL